MCGGTYGELPGHVCHNKVSMSSTHYCRYPLHSYIVMVIAIEQRSSSSYTVGQEHLYNNKSDHCSVVLKVIDLTMVMERPLI